MKESLIDRLVRKVSATVTGQKLSPSQRAKQEPAAAAGNDAYLKEILQVCKEMSANQDDLAGAARAVLAEIIIPRVLGGPEGQRLDHKQAKEFALACGQMVGLLAGLSLQESVINQAIDEVMLAAKANARGTVVMLKQSGFKSKPASGAPVHKPTSIAPEAQAKQDATTAQLEMIDSLERQALGEKDPASAAALRAMASNMKRELFAKATDSQAKPEEPAA